ncbi:hypothetical protein PMAYCL1PPCAC_14824, partial [Pristionchus mayeri]
AYLVNFCSASARSFILPAGTYFIGVSHTPLPLQISITYHKTNLGCNDEVPALLIGFPLTFEPTRHKCSLILPGRTVLEIKNIQRYSKEKTKNHRNCVRVRMGKHLHGLYWHWAFVCQIPANDFYEYELGCGAVVMDASSRAIERVEFVMRKMDELKAVVAPSMCSTDNDNDIPH